MTYTVDQNLCTGHACGKCVVDGATWFRWNNEGKAEVFHQPTPTEEARVSLIADTCPVNAIKEKATASGPSGGSPTDKLPTNDQ